MFLPSEMARLVLSYLIEHKLVLSLDNFIKESPHLQELKLFSAEEVCHHSKVNGRTLTDVLNEYTGMVESITKLTEKMDEKELELEQFATPVRVLKTLYEKVDGSSIKVEHKKRDQVISSTGSILKTEVIDESRENNENVLGSVESCQYETEYMECKDLKTERGTTENSSTTIDIKPFQEAQQHITCGEFLSIPICENPTQMSIENLTSLPWYADKVVDLEYLTASGYSNGSTRYVIKPTVARISNNSHSQDECTPCYKYDQYNEISCSNVDQSAYPSVDSSGEELKFKDINTDGLKSSVDIDFKQNEDVTLNNLLAFDVTLHEASTSAESNFSFIKPSNRKRKRCKQCSGCTKADCGTCKNCRDKPKFGGVGKLKRACLMRECDFMK